jgi:hypothetical protein
VVIANHLFPGIPGHQLVSKAVDQTGLVGGNGGYFFLYFAVKPLAGSLCMMWASNFSRPKNIPFLLTPPPV